MRWAPSPARSWSLEQSNQPRLHWLLSLLNEIVTLWEEVKSHLRQLCAGFVTSTFRQAEKLGEVQAVDKGRSKSQYVWFCFSLWIVSSPCGEYLITWLHFQIVWFHTFTSLPRGNQGRGHSRPSLLGCLKEAHGRGTGSAVGTSTALFDCIATAGRAGMIKVDVEQRGRRKLYWVPGHVLGKENPALKKPLQ